MKNATSCPVSQNTSTALISAATPPMPLPPQPSKLPLWLKLAYTAFMAVLVPVYWAGYGPTNFLYFCDIALLLTLVGVWRESPLLISMPAVGILLPQALWCADYVVELCGGHLVGMTTYMMDGQRSLFLRGLSLFHGWLPFLLVYLVKKLGYDGRGLPWWTGVGLAACLLSFFFLPGPGQSVGTEPCNVNFVHGPSEVTSQTWMPSPAYLLVWMAFLVVCVYTPTHFLLKKFFPRPTEST